MLPRLQNSGIERIAIGMMTSVQESSIMDQGNHRSQHDGTASEDCPSSTFRSRDIHEELRRLQDKLAGVQEHNVNLVWEKACWGGERLELCARINKLKYDLERATELLDLKEREFAAEYRKNYETISNHELEISSLKQRLRSQMELTDAVETQKLQETERMAAIVEAMTQMVSKQEAELLMLKLENKKILLLQDQLQSKVRQLERQLEQKDQLKTTAEEFIKDVVFNQQNREDSEPEEDMIDAAEKERREIDKKMKKIQKEEKKELKKEERAAKAEMKRREKEEKKNKKESICFHSLFGKCDVYKKIKEDD